MASDPTSDRAERLQGGRANDPGIQTQPLVSPAPRHHMGLKLIAVFKLIKGVLLFAAAIGLLKLLNTDISAQLEHLITVFRGDPENKYLHALLVKIANLDPRTLKAVSAGSFFYSALLLTEGIGLWFEKRWAEYLTVIATASFIPLELYELTRSVNDTKLAVLTINLCILLYLIRTLRHERKAKGH